MRPGFDAQMLVKRGVFDSLEEADAILCRLEDARTRSVIVASSWQLGLGFTVPITGVKFSRVAGTRNSELTNIGGLLAAGMPDRMPSLSRSLVRSGSAAVVSHPLQDGTAVAECSAGKQLEIACQSNSFCPWCAIESPGHGAAPRAGFVSAYRCARHAPNPEPAGTPVQCPQPITARDALSHAPAVVLRLPVSRDAAPFHPKLNPNAGVVPAFPKGRWS